MPANILKSWKRIGRSGGTAARTLLNESFETNSAIKQITQRRSDVTKNLHETELRLARLEVQMAQATERLQEEYSITREDALGRPDDTAIDKNTAMEVGRLRRELRAMGQVNTGAIGEYERLTERFDFLTAQRADLDKGREGLLATIAEIDDSTRGVFMETFEAVRSEFDRLFTRLFEGGSTKLVLTNPDDILETGIEVIAQPPGKKPQHLSLLSGGERALTATALLFSFLAVKPSPFVLLDEVDAPLDGANVEKYTATCARVRAAQPISAHHAQPDHDGSRADMVRRHHARSRRQQRPQLPRPTGIRTDYRSHRRRP